MPRTLATASVALTMLRHADRVRIVEREVHLRERWATAHPEVETTVVPALATDVHDLDGLRRIGGLLAGTDGTGTEAPVSDTA